jgi:hypothetical protein
VLPDGTALLFLPRSVATLLDADDLPLVLPYRWFFLPATGYATTNPRGGTACPMHTILSPDQRVDHANRNRLDNRRENLRPATQQQNSWNRRKSSTARVSRYKGVFFNHQRRRWFARVRKDGRSYSGGWGTSEEAAARWYNQKARELFGDFAKLNDLGLN